jgi:hypothetical protein
MIRTKLRRLERLIPAYGTQMASKKQELLGELAREQMPDAEAVLRLHECLVFLRAYPDDAEISAQVERLLSRFGRRADLREHRDELADSGVTGTPIYYAFYWRTARWLARHWPDRLSIDWTEFEGVDRLDELLPLLASHSEAPAMDAADFTAREWIERMRGPGESDAACLIRLFERIPADDFWRERSFESLETPFKLTPGPTTPSRTLARYGNAPIVYQTRPLVRKRPDLREAIELPPVKVRPLSVAEGRKIVDLAREAMATRSRDLDVFANADARDVRLVDCGDGLQFACIGVLPERRLLLESVYGFLTLKNGVPIGYVLTGTLFNSAEVAYNVFETYRGAEAGYVYGRVLSMTYHLLGAECFSVDPYQLGHHNAEGLGSGAWWFYYKFGFRARDAGVRRVAREELRRMKADPDHRSSRSTLKELVVAPVFWHLKEERADVLGRFPLGNVGLKVTDYLSKRFGGRRKDGEKICSQEAARLLGVRSVRSFSSGERVAWTRWAPLVLILPGIERWSSSDRRELVKVIRAKGGRRESDFVTRFDRHVKLRRAIARLGRGRR